MPQSIETVQGRILQRCAGLLLSRSTWPVLLAYLDSVDRAHWCKHEELIAWPAMSLIMQRTRLTRHRIEYGKDQLREIRLLIRLRHSFVGQPAIYKIDQTFTAPARYLRTLEGVPLARGLDRDAERGYDGEGEMMNELGARARLREDKA